MAADTPIMGEDGEHDIDALELIRLRDEFASEIATGIVMNRAEDSLAELADNAMEVAAAAYLIADKMMEVRRFPIDKVRKFMKARRVTNKVAKSKVPLPKQES